MKRLLAATLAGLAMTVASIGPAAATSGTMTFPEFGRVYLTETKQYVEVNNTGGDGHNCSCTGALVNEWTDSSGYDWIQIQYDTGLSSPAHSFVAYRWNSNDTKYHARQKWWGGTQYSMPAAP